MGYSIFDETMVDMTWPEIEKAAGEGAIVLLPIGIIEEHGPHMGLAVDTYIPYLLSVQAKRHLESRGTRTLIAPVPYWGISRSTSVFAGTFSVRNETMKALIYDILTSLHGWKLDRVFVIPWHAEYRHCHITLDAIADARRDTGMKAHYLLSQSDVSRLKLTGKEEQIVIQKAPPSMGEPKQYVDYHAGSLETGIMVQYFPGQVNIEMAGRLKDSQVTGEDLMKLGKSAEITRQVIPHGYFGDPASYDTEFARQYIESMSLDIANTITDYLKG